MEQKVIVLMTSSRTGKTIEDTKANLQKQIDETLAEHKGWRVMSANTTMAATSDHYGGGVTRFYTTTLILEDERIKGGVSQPL